MIYRNAKTGAVVKSNCVISGNGWEPAETVHNHHAEDPEPDEVEMEPEALESNEVTTEPAAAEVPVKKTSTSRRKK